MQNLAILQATFLFLQMIYVEGLMFPPELYQDSQQCTDNSNCATGCCLIYGDVDSQTSGICHSMGQFGQFCAPGERTNDDGVPQTYTYSCPCQPGLECKPLWVREHNGVTLVQDPKCTPREMSPHSPVISKLLSNTFLDVPVE